MTQHHYNPDWLDDDSLAANFIARQNDFKFLRDELAHTPLMGTAQHHLLIGQRGAGKTTLLKRLAVAIRRDPDLADHLIALSFPEELYQVKNLADFWWACCDALADELDRQKQFPDMERWLNQVESVKHRDETKDKEAAAQSDAGLQLLLAECQQRQRRPVLLVDNLDMVFERIDKSGRKLKNPNAPAYWALREALSHAESPVVIGGSVRLSEPFTDYDKAFYDFFMPKRLGKLSLEEVMKVLHHLAEHEQATEVTAMLRARPSRIETLNELTGGNPRALGLIFQLLRQGVRSRAVDDFERLMDLTTPYYKARFEDLPEQAQVVMHALAVRRPPLGTSELRFGHTAAELADHSGLVTSSVSAQLDTLEREGLVEKNATHGRTQYRIAEQLFRLWLQMRANRRIRQNVIGLTEFLEALFSEDELQAAASQAPEASGLADARFAMALADTKAAAPLRHSLEARAVDQMLRYQEETGGAATLEECLPPVDLNVDLARLTEWRQRLAKDGPIGLNPQEQDALLGSLDLRAAEQKTWIDRLCSTTTPLSEADITALRQRLTLERRKLLRYGLLESDLPLLYELRAKALLALPHLHPEQVEHCLQGLKHSNFRPMIWRLVGARRWVRFTAENGAQAWLEWGKQHMSGSDANAWANVAGSFRLSDRLDEAQIALDMARGKNSDDASVWFETAALSESLKESPAVVEVAYRRAIELDPSSALPWNNFGRFLKSLKRLDGAEAAYRRAIELDPTYALPWNNFGLLLSGLKRLDEAEAAYRHAIELDPADASPWNRLGNVLRNLKRSDEAEAAYQHAIELDPSSAMPWNNFGLLLSGLKRLDEAEAAYRRAIELDPTYALPWNNLGHLLNNLKRFNEAETAYAQALELDKNPTEFWQERQREPKIARLALSARDALTRGQEADLTLALDTLLTLADSPSSVFGSSGVVRELLAPVLAEGSRAGALLDAMRRQGWARHARPLLLAYEAALVQRPALLDELEPEVRSASKRLYARLMIAT